MLETLSAAGPFPSIEKLDSIARKTGLIVRESKRFSAHGFLLSLIQTAIRVNNSLNHKGNQHHMEALILAAMIYQTITLKLQATLRSNPTNNCKRGHPDISYEKLCDATAQLIVRLTKDKINATFEFDPRHISHDKRTRQTLYATGIQSLA